jgi:hypothetical protein
VAEQLIDRRALRPAPGLVVGVDPRPLLLGHVKRRRTPGQPKQSRPAMFGIAARPGVKWMKPKAAAG